MLGAGLDTFGYRNPHPASRSSRSTTPTPAAWKRERLAEAGIDRAATSATSASTSSATTCCRRLVEAGLDAERPTFFLWLGVVPYLTQDAIAATLGALGALPGAEVVLDYPTRPTGSTSRPGAAANGPRPSVPPRRGSRC